MVKVKVFSHEEDAFDDVFLQKETFTDVNHMASLLFDPEDLEAFHEYRERRLLKVPLDQLQIELIREPTPIISLEESSRENSKDDSEAESQEKSTRESEKSEKQSQNGGSKSKELEKDIARIYTKSSRGNLI